MCAGVQLRDSSNFVRNLDRDDISLNFLMREVDVLKLGRHAYMGTLPTRVQILVFASFSGFIPGFSALCVKW
jgi:hypothetical protein